MIVVHQGGMDFAHGISFEFKSIGVVDEAVKDRIGEGGVGDAGVPVLDRDLGGDQGSAAAVTIVEDLEQVFGLGAGERVAEPVVEDEQVGAGQGPQQLGIGAVSLSEFERLQQAGSAQVAHIEFGLTGSPSQCTR